MLYPYTFQELHKERLENLLNEAELNRKLKAKGSKQGNHFGLIKQLADTIEELLVTNSGRLNERHISLNPFNGRIII